MHEQARQRRIGENQQFRDYRAVRRSGYWGTSLRIRKRVGQSAYQFTLRDVYVHAACVMRSNHKERLARVYRRGGVLLPEVNFITLHYCYFIFTSLLTGLILWGSATPFGSISFTDSFFLTASAMTEAGLNTVNLSTLNTWQQFMLFFLIIIGSAIFVSAFVVLVRVQSFEKEFDKVLKDRGPNLKARRSLSFRAGDVVGLRPRSLPGVPSPERHTAERQSFFGHADPPVLNHGPSAAARTRDKSYQLAGALSPHESENRSSNIDGVPNALGLTSPVSPLSLDRPDQGIAFRSDTIFQRSAHNVPEPMRHPLWYFTGEGVLAESPLRSRTTSRYRMETNGSGAALSITGDGKEPSGILPDYRGRNSTFHHLSYAEREELGGLEYRAVVLLSVLVPLYFVLWQLLGSLSLGAWVAQHRAATTRANGIDPWWTGAFK